MDHTKQPGLLGKAGVSYQYILSNTLGKLVYTAAAARSCPTRTTGMNPLAWDLIIVYLVPGRASLTIVSDERLQERPRCDWGIGPIGVRDAGQGVV